MSSMGVLKTKCINPPPLANDSLCPLTFQWEEGVAMAMLVYLTMQYWAYIHTHNICIHSHIQSHAYIHTCIQSHILTQACAPRYLNFAGTATNSGRNPFGRCFFSGRDLEGFTEYQPCNGGRPRHLWRYQKDYNHQGLSLSKTHSESGTERSGARDKVLPSDVQEISTWEEYTRLLTL